MDYHLLLWELRPRPDVLRRSQESSLTALGKHQYCSASFHSKEYGLVLRETFGNLELNPKGRRTQRFRGTPTPYESFMLAESSLLRGTLPVAHHGAPELSRSAPLIPLGKAVR